MTPGPWAPAPGGAAVGLALDALLGDPPDAWHPVAWFGRAMERVEQTLYADRRARGAAHTVAGIVAGAGAGAAVRSAAAATFVAGGGRGLARAARSVAAAVDAGDLDEARRLLPWLAGRDPEGLSAEEICRAVVESVAENTVDAVVAPAFWGAVGGAPAVLAHRAANTMDAMVGHHSDRYERYGWASARLDDGANWIPARLTAGLVAAVRPRRAAAVRRVVARDAGRHPSPNAGVAEAAFAAALGVTLGGTNRYRGRVDERPLTGNGPRPGTRQVEEAVRLSRDVTLATTALLGLSAAAIRMRRDQVRGRRRRPSP